MLLSFHDCNQRQIKVIKNSRSTKKDKSNNCYKQTKQNKQTIVTRKKHLKPAPKRQNARVVDYAKSNYVKYWASCHAPSLPLLPILRKAILMFCGTERSFQWYPDQSDRLSGTWDMHRNAQKIWMKKVKAKFSCDYTFS